MKFVKHPNLGHTHGVFDMEDLAHRFTKEQLEKLEFGLVSYSKMMRFQDDPVWTWNIFFKHVNAFLETLQDDEKVVLAQFIIGVHDNLVNYVEKGTGSDGECMDIPTFIQQQGNGLMLLDQKLKLTDRLINYVKEGNVRMADFSEAGTKIGHREAITWRLPESIELTGYVLLSKLMSPIMSAMMEYMEKAFPESFTTQLKTIYVANLIIPTLSRHHPHLYNKLGTYIECFVRKHASEDSRSVMTGTTVRSAIRRTLGSVLVRNFVNAELDKPSGSNPMTFLHRAITNSSETISSGGYRKSQFELRDPTRYASDDNDGLGSLEGDSTVSREPMYKGVIVCSLAPVMLKRFWIANDIDADTVQAAAEFYQANQFNPTYTAEVLMAGVFGGELSGGEGISSLSFTVATEFIATLQAMCFIRGLFALGHFLTAKRSEMVSVEFNTDVGRMRWRVGGSDEYRLAKERFNLTGENIWFGVVNKVIDEVSKYKYHANTAPVFWDKLSRPDLKDNDFVLPAVEDFCQQFSRFTVECVLR